MGEGGLKKEIRRPKEGQSAMVGAEQIQISKYIILQ